MSAIKFWLARELAGFMFPFLLLAALFAGYALFCLVAAGFKKVRRSAGKDSTR